MNILSILSNQIIFAPILLAVDEFGFILPIGDIIVLYTGYQVAKGKVSFTLAFLLLLSAVLIGASALYYLSFRYGQTVLLKLEKYIHLDMKKLEVIEKKFNKYGPIFIIFGRHIPGFRIPITIFSGMSEITYPTFIISVVISTIFWLAFYLSIGMKLGPKTIALLSSHHNYLFPLLIPILIIVIAYRYLQKKKK